MSDQAIVLLPDGKVLVASSGDTTVNIFDPASGGFAVAGRMQFSHGAGVSAALLNDDRVLIVGGNITPSAAELYDPASGQFTAIGQTIQPHGYGATATLLNDGRVLVVGGLAVPGNPPTTTVDDSAGAELYDPTTGKFASAGAMASNRNEHTATLLADGRVLVAGGNAEGGSTPMIFDTAEIYNPVTGQFTLAGSMQAVRAHHFAVLLPNGKVLVGGGFGPGIAATELFDPVAGSFTATGSMSSASRADPTATLLSSGQVLVAGGVDDTGVAFTSSAELYNPATAAFAITGSMVTARAYAKATLLLDGRVLVTGGGAGGSTSLSSSEIYTPVTEGLVTSQTGLTFRVAAGSGLASPQTVAVLTTTATIPWTVSTHTYEGGNWLIATPSSGNSVPGAAPVTLTIAANAAGLAAQDYYGAVILTPTDGVHPPISIAIVLSIVPAGSVVPPAISPSGLLFLGTPGATLSPQSFSISNLTSTPITFTGVGSTTPKWFSFTPATGTINGAQAASITVTPTMTGLTAGVYPGTIKLTFGDGSTQTVQLLLVISATAGTAHARLAAASADYLYAQQTPAGFHDHWNRFQRSCRVADSDRGRCGRRLRQLIQHRIGDRQFHRRRSAHQSDFNWQR